MHQHPLNTPYKVKTLYTKETLTMIKPFLGAFLIAILMMTPAAAYQPQDVYNEVCVNITSPSEAKILKSLGLEITVVKPDGDVFLVVRDSELSMLTNAGFSYEIIIPDMEKFFEKRLDESKNAPSITVTSRGRAFPDGSMGGYYTLKETEDMLDAWALQYPNLITPKMSIGKSIEGRDIWAVKISDNPNIDENEPEVYFDGLVHAREPMSMMTIVYYMLNLLDKYGIDPELTHLVDNREIWCVLVHNPDGYYYNETTNPNGGGMWRKNRRLNIGGSVGVDLNRNYGFKWGYDNSGSSPTPSSTTYRGTGPFSEPETQAVRDFFLQRPIVTSWNTHCYSNLYLCPFGYDNVYPYGNDWPIFQEILLDISAENGYEAGTIYDILYNANGGAVDWHYAVAGSFALTPEIGNSSDNFWPPKNRIIPLAEENFMPIKHFTWVGGSYVVRTGHTMVDDSGDGLFLPGEPVEVAVTIRNKGLEDTTGSVILNISSSSPYVDIINGSYDFGVLASMTDADNKANPLVIKVKSSAPYGEVISLSTDIVFEGLTLTAPPMNLVCGVPTVVSDYDMEVDPGWTVGDIGDDATAGIWERSNPIGTY